MPYLTLSIMEKPFCIHRLPADATIPSEITHSPFFILTRSENEVSLVLPEDVSIRSLEHDSDWVCIKAAILPHQDGSSIIAHISAVLAEKAIQMFITSGMDAHYFLIKVEHLIAAKKALENARCRFLKAQ